MESLLEQKYVACQSAYQDFEMAAKNHVKFHLDLYANKNVILTKLRRLRECIIDFQKLFMKNPDMQFGVVREAFEITKRLFWSGTKFFVFSETSGRIAELEALLGELERAEQQKNEVEAQRIVKNVKALLVDMNDQMSAFAKYGAMAVKQVRPSRLKAA